MTIEIKAPTFPESVADGVVSAWHKAVGESVARDELLVEIETDKVVMEVVAPAPGVIEAILVGEGETILSETLLATLAEGEVAEAPSYLKSLKRTYRKRQPHHTMMRALLLALSRQGQIAFRWGLPCATCWTNRALMQPRSQRVERAGDY